MRAAAAIAACVTAAVTLATMLGGCSAAVPNGAPDPSLRGEWELASATDGAGPLDLTRSHITLTIDRDATTNGRSACNDYSARIYGTLGSLWVTARLSKSVATCQDPSLEDVERRYLAALDGVRAGSVVGGVLDLTAPGIRLHFARALALPLGQVVGAQWRLASLSTGDRYQNAQPLPNRYEATIQFTPDGRVHGSGGCRTFDGRYHQNAGQLLLTGLQFGESSYCDGPTEAIENQVIRVLGDAFRFQVGGDFLLLTDDQAAITLLFSAE